MSVRRTGRSILSLWAFNANTSASVTIGPLLVGSNEPVGLNHWLRT
jgi:hypothetical protein